MKVTCTSEQNAFKPVTISITCESKEELFALWHRFNVTNKYIWEQSNETEEDIPNGDIDIADVWNSITREVEKHI